MSELDRRQSPRFTIQVPLQVTVPTTDTKERITAASLNISMNGIYCKINRYIPLFEQVRILFVIPQETPRPSTLVSECQAVVVRVEPENEEPERDEYNIALYFHKLSRADRIKLRALIAKYSPYLSPSQGDGGGFVGG